MRTFCFAQPATPSELGWPHPIPQLGNTNPPPNCPAFAEPASLVVVTDTVTSITLPGGNGVFSISQNPANGTLSGLNPTTGTITYTAGNTPTTDLFVYCVSNSPTCITCAPVNVTIQTLAQITCGNCYNTPPQNGGVTTGNIYFNVGESNEQVCIYYTNTTCTALSTNCQISDDTGEVTFFVHMCATSSNYCIASLATANYVCWPTKVTVSGAGKAVGYLDPNGVYYFQSIGSVTPPLNVILTNSNPAALGDVYMLYNGSFGNIVPASCFNPNLPDSKQTAMIADNFNATESVLTNLVFVPLTPCLYPLGQDSQMVGWDYPANCTSPSAYPPPAPTSVTIQEINSLTTYTPICP